MEKERNYDNDGLDPSEEYFRKKKEDNDDDTYFPPQLAQPPVRLIPCILLMILKNKVINFSATCDLGRGFYFCLK